MRADDDKIPSLAELRRGGARRRRIAEPAPSLFDLIPENETRAEAEITIVSRAPSPVLEPVRREPAVAEVPPTAPREPKIFTVAELVRQVRGLVERTYGTITVEGEISNWRPAASGHCYFTLKDGAAQLSIVMFRAQVQRLRFRPKDGDAVRITGQVTVYESRGQMQLVAERMEQVGLGALLAATRELKEKLRREGLFDRKRPLPAFPRCIGVVTSLQGAALRDIVKVCRRRHAGVNLLVYPAAVQGPRCAIEVERGIRWFSRHPERADVVIVARGGGSWEDLHGFDDERVVRAIAACGVPVIAGIGHATDSTIADAAADVCAPTPSAAAELVTAFQHQLEDRLERLQARVLRAGQYELLRARQRFSRLSAEMVLRRAQDGLGRRAQRLDDLTFRAEASANRRLRRMGDMQARLDARLQQRHPAVVVAGDRRRLEALAARLERAAHNRTAARKAVLERAEVRLHALSPLRVLERGYALVYGPGGGLLREATAVQPGETVVARLHHGRITAKVDSTTTDTQVKAGQSKHA